jgi:hypothetical protein
MMLLLLDENTNGSRKPASFEAAPSDPSILYIFDHAKDWLELCADSGPQMQQFAEQGFADQGLVAKCVDELNNAIKWPYYQDVRSALKASVGTVTLEAE